jgi:hypothetical protein
MPRAAGTNVVLHLFMPFTLSLVPCAGVVHAC